MPTISPQAVVDRTAELADDARVGPFSYVGPDARLGAGCIIENNVTILDGCELGAKTRVFPMAVVGARADDDQSPPRCIIGQACSIREHVTIYAGDDAHPTRIGDDTLLMIDCQVGAGAQIGDHGIFANCTVMGAGCRIEDYVRTSAFAVVSDSMGVGAYTFIAAYTDIDHDAPPFAIVQGLPYRVRGVNAENLRRCGFGEDDIRGLKEAFRSLFGNQGLQIDLQALGQLLTDGNAHIRRLAEAVKASGPEGAP